jgi:K(+)-stimulated pyrophosphate-energized sodium pump
MVPLLPMKTVEGTTMPAGHDTAIEQAAAAAEAAAVAAATAAANADTGGMSSADEVQAAASDSGSDPARMAKIYFASGSAALPADAAATMDRVLMTLKGSEEAKAMISGYHDLSGDPAKNAELSKARAQAVQKALVAAGIAEDRIELQKPQATGDGGSADEARRVEITVQ